MLDLETARRFQNLVEETHLEADAIVRFGEELLVKLGRARSVAPKKTKNKNEDIGFCS